MSQTIDNHAARRFELEEGGGVSFADYVRRDGVVAITHVETPAHLRGQGIAGRLMAGIAALVRARGEKIQPVCPYAAAWMRRNPGEQDLLG